MSDNAIGLLWLAYFQRKETKMKSRIIDPNKSYSFHDYFKLNLPLNDLLAYFGYSKQNEICNLPKAMVDLSYFDGVKIYLESFLRIANLSSETARREILVAPILLHLGVYLQIPIEIEYPLNINKQLKGKLDYYIQGQGNLLVIEAKHDDLSRGFTQLAVELIALDKWLDDDPKPLYGIVSVGDIWKFGILNRTTKLITQDINAYRVPADMYELLQILIAILNGVEASGSPNL